jgi:hypothetical protein
MVKQPTLRCHTLANRATMHLLHLNCFSDYNVERELDVLQHITLPKRDKTDNADIPDLLLTAHDYLRDIVMEYATVVEEFTVQCNATVTQRSNPSYRLFVPSAPPTPIAGRRLWNERFVQHLFSVVNYVDVEVVRRNNLDSTNFETFTNQIKKLFKDLKVAAGTCGWWHDLQNTSTKRRTFRLVILDRPDISNEYLQKYTKRPGAVWNDFIGTHSVRSTDLLNLTHHIKNFHGIANQQIIHITAIINNRYLTSDEYNVKITTIDEVPFSQFREITRYESDCMFI